MQDQEQPSPTRPLSVWWSTPLLVFYAGLVLSRAQEPFQKDEITYHSYAENLLTGRFAPDGTEFLWCGPGYPLLIVPFVALGDSLLAIKLLNAVLLWAAVLIVYRTAATFLPRGRAVVPALALAFYWPLFSEIELMMSEVFAAFLVAVLLGSLCRYFRALRSGTESNRHFFASACTFAYLAMTKLVFGYVIPVVLILAAVVFLVRRGEVWLRTASIAGVALVLCIPYLAYTYSITGKPFLWGTSGGMQLYWMSSPHAEERGDWINYTLAGRYDPTTANPVIKNHGELFAAALNYDAYYEDEPWDAFTRRLGTKQDAMLRHRAMENIAAHPGKYLRNWIDNISRMLFDTPYSYRNQPAAFWQFGVPNILLLGVLGFAMVVRLWHRTPVPEAAWSIGLIVLAYLLLSSLVSAYPRQFYITSPALALGVAIAWPPKWSYDSRDIELS